MAFMTRGPAPVDEDPEGSLLEMAIDGHGGNIDILETTSQITFRDDKGIIPAEPRAGIDYISPSSHVEEIAATGAAVYNFSGWYDGAYHHAAVKRHLNLPGSQSKLLLGPWPHGGRRNDSPFPGDRDFSFDQEGELLRFFDHHLKGADNGIMDEAPVRYFTFGEGRWRTADCWPPPEAQPIRWFLGPGRALTGRAPERGGQDPYRVDPEAGTGRRSRWRSLIGNMVPVGYDDRRERDRRLLCYNSPPLAEALVVAGHPILHLYLRADGPDAAIFVYLEDVAPSGRVTMVTEGQLRARHRKLHRGRPLYRSAVPQRTFRRADSRPLPAGETAELIFDLLPISYRFEGGHSLRLALACADRDNFSPLEKGPTTVWICRGGEGASFIELPVL